MKLGIFGSNWDGLGCCDGAPWMNWDGFIDVDIDTDWIQMQFTPCLCFLVPRVIVFPNTAASTILLCLQTTSQCSLQNCKQKIFFLINYLSLGFRILMQKVSAPLPWEMLYQTAEWEFKMFCPCCLLPFVWAFLHSHCVMQTVEVTRLPQIVVTVKGQKHKIW